LVSTASSSTIPMTLPVVISKLANSVPGPMSYLFVGPTAWFSAPLLVASPCEIGCILQREKADSA
jgi:hypothetical protein